MRQVLALATSVLTLTGMWLAGSHRWQGWLVGLLNQALWLAFIVAFGAWGLLPLSLALIVVYGRNLSRWRHDAVSQLLAASPASPAVTGAGEIVEDLDYSDITAKPYLGYSAIVTAALCGECGSEILKWEVLPAKPREIESGVVIYPASLVKLHPCGHVRPSAVSAR